MVCLPMVKYLNLIVKNGTNVLCLQILYVQYDLSIDLYLDYFRNAL